MKPLSILLLAILTLPACDDQRLGRAVARQFEGLGLRLDAAMKPVVRGYLVAGLSRAGTDELEAARVKAVADLEAIRHEFETAVLPRPSLAFGQELHDAFSKYLDESIKLVKVDLEEVTTLMYRAMNHPEEKKHLVMLDAATQGLGEKAAELSEAYSAMLRNFAGAHGMKVYGN